MKSPSEGTPTPEQPDENGVAKLRKKTGILATNMFQQQGIPRPRMGSMTSFVEVEASRVTLHGAEFRVKALDLKRKGDWNVEVGQVLAVKLAGPKIPQPLILSGVVEEVIGADQTVDQAHVMKLRFHEMELDQKRVLVDWIQYHRRSEPVTITVCKPETLEEQERSKKRKSDIQTRPSFANDRDSTKVLGSRPKIFQDKPEEKKDEPGPE
ncbi:MAG TPA: PilZ domain-containing protein [Planctomycetota bacterium]|nr:PilZ domain-containing protein [Planctomycetota bacterium]